MKERDEQNEGPCVECLIVMQAMSGIAHAGGNTLVTCPECGQRWTLSAPAEVSKMN